MIFCSKCGAVLDKEEDTCPSCTNLSLLDNPEKLNSNSTIEPKNEELPILYIIIKTAKLLVDKGGTVGREFPIRNEVCNIGRWDPKLDSHPDVDLSDEDLDSKVSRIHARILTKKEGFYIQDMGSTNGTYLNREFRLVEGIEYALKNRDEIIIGHIFLRFIIND